MTASNAAAAAAAAAASRSAPGSRRNSNDERSNNLFESSMNHNDTPIDFFTKPPPRSFSVDVGSMHGGFNHHTSFFSEANHNADSNSPYGLHNYLYSRYYNNGNSSGGMLNDNVNANYGLFASTTDLDLESNLRSNSARSVESLRSKSWGQYLDHSAPLPPQQPSQLQQQQFYSSAPGPLDVSSAHDVQAAFYGQPVRRFSHGWPLTTTTTSATTTTSSTVVGHTPNHATSTLPKNSRLATSYSYSDIQMAAALGSYRMNNSGTYGDVCQQFRQYGYCTLKEQCPFSHTLTSQQQQQQLQEPSTPALRYSNSTSTCNSNNMTDTTAPLSTTLYEPFIFNLKQQEPQQVKRSSTTTTAAGLSMELAPPEMNKFAGVPLEEFKGRLYELCKDQHGCRFLQTKMEESSTHVSTIYEEVHTHFVDLMTDPFGNYLCQKLLERCNDAQRSVIVDVIAPDFLKICLSMHGTRAVQKLIEFLSTKRQIQAVIVALEPNVVALIKDLNGNHVIQKCLHKLSPEHNQFIYDTVSEHCIQVASHKHGCCVYQRCIDHATPSQKAQLVNVITHHALPLVQDPFGNYVVQYVLELGDAAYSDNLIRRFIEPIRKLSVQKFSSNVIEKCIRVAERDTRRLLIEGIINHPNMDKFLRDSYANYVIQTCLDFAEDDQRAQFVACIRPFLPSIRNTPYGKRIYSKIHNNPGNNINNSSSSNSSSSRYIRQHQQRMLDTSAVTTTTSIITGLGSLNINKSLSSEQKSNADGGNTSVYI